MTVQTANVDVAPSGPVTFTCNICDSRCVAGPSEFGRDTPSCPKCHSTPRIRAVVHVLSDALFGQSMRISEFPIRPDLAGIGLSDWGYAPRLAAKLAYRNTFYDREPQLDITDPPRNLQGTLDFVISSDVFEHVPPPVERAFEGAFRLLKPGGVFVVTVPYLYGGETIEHYPSLHEFEIVEFGGSRILINRTADGRWEVFDDLKFHGGEGLTLEMRIFSRAALRQQLRAAGFHQIVDWKDRVPEFRACWQEPHSFPVVARRPIETPAATPTPAGR